MPNVTKPRTIDQARTLAAIETRARTLFTEQGYTYKFAGVDGCYAVQKPDAGEFGPFYIVDVNAPYCECKSFENFGTCKHYLGLKMELAADAALCAEHERNMQDAETFTGCDWPEDF